MLNRVTVIILILLLITVGCSAKLSEHPAQKSPTPGDATPGPAVVRTRYQVVYITNDNKVCLKDVQTGDTKVIYTSDEPLEIIVPNPTMKVMALTTEGDDNNVGCVKIYDWEHNQTLHVYDLQSEMPIISWSPDGCYLMLYEPAGNWGSALIYDFVNHLVCSSIMAIGEPIWNPDSNRITTNTPEEVDKHLPYGDGHSSSVIVYKLSDNMTNTILKGDENSLYRPLMWLETDTIAFEQINVDSAIEEIHQIDLTNSEKTNITDKAQDLLYPQEEIPNSFYEYQYFEFSDDKKYAILCTTEEDFSGIKLWKAENEEVTELAEGYCAYWVDWK